MYADVSALSFYDDIVVRYGKWDCGMATPDHTPHGRGYQHSMVYYHHVNDAWNSIPWNGIKCQGNVTDSKGERTARGHLDLIVFQTDMGERKKKVPAF